MNQIIINKKTKKVDICVVEDNVICEKYLHDIDNESILGNIYSGIVVNVVDGMQAAFVDIGEKKNAFMPVKDALPKVDILKEEVCIKPISEVVKIGQKILIQVRKEPVNEKGARVSTHITFPGNYIILMPNSDIITVSQKIEDEDKKNKLKELMKNLLPSGYGAIVRTDAENVGEHELKRDLEELLKKWHAVIDKFKKSNGKELIYNDHELAKKVLRDLVNSKTEKVICNSNDICQDLKKLSENIEIEYIQTGNVFETIGILSEAENADKRKVWLKCGGYIAIDKTEALTAIDVNSGKYVGKNDLEETAFKVNEEAAVEIMKQIKLKDIGGIIVIDYIDMTSKQDQEKILEIMKQEAKKDRSKIDIKEFTKLNLVEMTRKKMYV
ncbi:MAG: Rne/Rng family ribonuclease [Clostridia bacterium]|nr:Rne/Rng family ribonuclease [Clostridia bacterium]